MRKVSLVIVCLVSASLLLTNGAYAKTKPAKKQLVADTVKATIMTIVNTVIKASGTFDIKKVADLYTPNAVVADEEPPYSWNGTTAGIQWVNTVEKTIKQYKLSNFKGKVQTPTVFYQSGDSAYIVVPVHYSADTKDEPFDEDGVFTFIFRIENGKWLIKSQVWTTKKGM